MIFLLLFVPTLILCLWNSRIERWLGGDGGVVLYWVCVRCIFLSGSRTNYLVSAGDSLERWKRVIDGFPDRDVEIWDRNRARADVDYSRCCMPRHSNAVFYNTRVKHLGVHIVSLLDVVEEDFTIHRRILKM